MRMAEVYLSDEVSSVVIPMIVKINGKKQISSMTVDEIFKSLSKLGADHLKVVKQLKKWKVLTAASFSACIYLYLKSRKLALRNSELIDQVDILELEKAFNEDEEEIEIEWDE